MASLCIFYSHSFEGSAVVDVPDGFTKEEAVKWVRENMRDDLPPHNSSFYVKGSEVIEDALCYLVDDEEDGDKEFE